MIVYSNHKKITHNRVNILKIQIVIKDDHQSETYFITNIKLIALNGKLSDDRFMSNGQGETTTTIIFCDQLKIKTRYLR